jgi:hypothetical protein
MKAIIYLNGIPDHKEPYPYKYCVQLAFKLDPKGEILRVRVVEG